MPSSEQISDFVAFTCGASVEDARRYLELTNCNVEEAVTLYFTSSESGVNNTSSSSSSSPLRNSQAKRNVDAEDYGFIYEDDVDCVEEVRSAIPSKRQRLYDNSSGILLPGTQIANMDKPVISTFASGKGSKQSAKQEVLAKLYEPPFDIMFSGPFLDLRNHAKNMDKWILVNIQKEEEFSSHILNRDVWSNDTVKEIIKFGFIFWQKHDTTASASDFLQMYKITPSDSTFPLIVIIDPITKSLIKTLKNSGNIPELLGDFFSESSTPSVYWGSKNVSSTSDSSAKPVVLESESVRDSNPVQIQQAPTNLTNQSLFSSAHVGFLATEVMSVIDTERPLECSANKSEKKTCSIRLVMPSGQKFKESFAEGSETQLGVVLKRVIDRLTEIGNNDKRFDLLYGYPPKSLSKSLLGVDVKNEGMTVASNHLSKNIAELNLANETITVRFV